MATSVVIGNPARKQLRKVPRHVIGKLMLWVDAVETLGLEQVRRVPGFHDEPIKGRRRGQRSIRLSRSYRAFYVVEEDGTAEIVRIDEVNKHVY